MKTKDCPLVTKDNLNHRVIYHCPMVDKGKMSDAIINAKLCMNGECLNCKETTTK